MEHVWVLDFSAENEDTGDYMGWQTVHATKESAVQLMFTRFDELGIDYDSPALEVTASSEADDGSECKDFSAPQWGWERISYGIQRTEVLRMNYQTWMAPAYAQWEEAQTIRDLCKRQLDEAERAFTAATDALVARRATWLEGKS